RVARARKQADVSRTRHALIAFESHVFNPAQSFAHTRCPVRRRVVHHDDLNVAARPKRALRAARQQVWAVEGRDNQTDFSHQVGTDYSELRETRQHTLVISCAARPKVRNGFYHLDGRLWSR